MTSSLYVHTYAALHCRLHCCAHSRCVEFVTTSNGCTYPHIVLQHAWREHGLHQVRMPIHTLITHLTQGPMPDGCTCVCHFDTHRRDPPCISNLKWEQAAASDADRDLKQPHPAQCCGLAGTMCVSPCCTFYGTAALNAASVDHTRTPNRLRRVTKAICSKGRARRCMKCARRELERKFNSVATRRGRVKSTWQPSRDRELKRLGAAPECEDGGVSLSSGGRRLRPRKQGSC